MSATVNVKLLCNRTGNDFQQSYGDVVTMDVAEARRHLAENLAELLPGQTLPADRGQEPGDRSQEPADDAEPTPRTEDAASSAANPTDPTDPAPAAAGRRKKRRNR